MHIAEHVARLERIGSDNSGTMSKLREAVWTLIELLRQAAHPLENPVLSLPDGWRLTLDENETRLLNYNLGIQLTSYTCVHMAQPQIMGLARTISEGWLDKVAEYLETEYEKLRETRETIGGATEVLSALNQ